MGAFVRLCHGLRVFRFLAGSSWGISSEGGGSLPRTVWLCPLSKVALVTSSCFCLILVGSAFLLPPSQQALNCNWAKHKMYQDFQVKMHISCSFCVCSLISSSSHSLGIESCKCCAFQTILLSWTVRTKPISASSVRDTSDLDLGKQGGSSRFGRVCIDILSWRLPGSCTEGRSPCPGLCCYPGMWLGTPEVFGAVSPSLPMC